MYLKYDISNNIIFSESLGESLSESLDDSRGGCAYKNGESLQLICILNYMANKNKCLKADEKNQAAMNPS